tara:strand:- start:121 stop:354 length:234 start_codon:yes stop_codon:yes gene_type:complete
MLRKFVCKVTHCYSDDERVEREHIIYMPQSEYDTSGVRYKNHSWVKDKLEEKLGKRFVDGDPFTDRWYVNSIRQEKL